MRRYHWSIILIFVPILMNKQYNYLLSFFIIGVLMITSCKDKAPETEPDESLEVGGSVDYTYRPLVHHFGSTNCGGCGRWAVPLIHQVAEEMGDTIVPLITHFKYEDIFITESSDAIVDGIIESWYSPQVWINDRDITFDIINSGQRSSELEVMKRLRSLAKEKADVYIGFTAADNDRGRLDATVQVKNSKEDSASYFLEIYTMRDGEIASQAGADPYVTTHYKVNKGGHFGGMGKELKMGANEVFSENLELIPCYQCDGVDIYFYVILWQKKSNGKYGYVNGKVFFPK